MLLSGLHMNRPFITSQAKNTWNCLQPTRKNTNHSLVHFALMQYHSQPDGTLKNGKIFFDCSFTEDDEALDGMKVDKEGNLYVSAPGGVWILSARGILPSKIVTPERPADMAWGDEDTKTLYLTA